ncbi:Transmembrane and TPR repeat-containing protein 1 [Eumeta japonica]|uniref:Transmembrane and TPR repeat-containing protein 1 n=1 Tax=Eumeta variegata TaxID=151549 RepID=A0A4C1V3X5_EUMVA|nr:Transmembrane and TPR repeat-containing protein 1 [Eumeta japonica]
MIRCRADLATLPQNAKLHYNFANFLRESEQQEGAIEHYKEALRLWPTYASAHNNLGTLVAQNDDAEYHFLQAIKFNRYHLNAHYNLGKLYKKSGKVTEAMNMFDECVWLEPRFVQAYVELLTMKPDSERHGLLKSWSSLNPATGSTTCCLPAAASKFYLQAVQLSFQHRNVISKPLRGDLVAIRSTALVLRDLGQKSRILQLLTRWHTWRRGAPSAAAHVYMREWRLRVELAGRAQAYSQATSNPVRTRRCFDHSQLTVATKWPEQEKRTSQEEKHKNNEMNRVINDDVKQLLSSNWLVMAQETIDMGWILGSDSGAGRNAPRL